MSWLCSRKMSPWVTQGRSHVKPSHELLLVFYLFLRNYLYDQGFLVVLAANQMIFFFYQLLDSESRLFSITVYRQTIFVEVSDQRWFPPLSPIQLSIGISCISTLLLIFPMAASHWHNTPSESSHICTGKFPFMYINAFTAKTSWLF